MAQLNCRFVVKMFLLVGLGTAMAHAATVQQQQQHVQAWSDPSVSTFYVSPTNGNNSNSGTSPSAAWQTLEYASQQTTLVKGPFTMLLQRGEIFQNDPFTVDATVRQLGYDVTIGAYGPASQPAPLVQQTRAMLTGSACMGVYNIGGGSSGSLVVSGLHFSGCVTGLGISASLGVTAHNVVISENVFMDIREPYLSFNPAGPKWASAIAMGGNYYNMTIRNNIAARVDMFANPASVNSLVIDGNTFQDCRGNCVGLQNLNNTIFQNNVFNRDSSGRAFIYGTTDIIVGQLDGDNLIQNNDFNTRGEYEGGPDGCAFDFETAAKNVVVTNNMFYKSYGSGIMILGHASSGPSKNITISDNVFFECGCTQTAGDSGALAIGCGGGFRPTGTLLDNTIYKCKGPNANPPINVAPTPPDCAGKLNMTGTRIDPSQQQVERPQVQLSPPSANDASPTGTCVVFGKTRTSNATVRYTLDGSRPSVSSAVLPPGGLTFAWPGPVVNINLKAFRDGWIPSVTNGAVLELNYIWARLFPGAANLGPAGVQVASIRGSLDGVAINKGTAVANGWVVDPLLPGNGWGPVTIVVYVDAVPVASAVATGNRPDIVHAKMAPNAAHGFNVQLPSDAAAALLSAGTHVLSVKAVGTPGTVMPTLLPGASSRVCTNGTCEL